MKAGWLLLSLLFIVIMAILGALMLGFRLFERADALPPGLVVPGFTRLSAAEGDLELPSTNTQQAAAQILDVDMDGLNDFIIGTRVGDGDSMVWYRRTAGGWQRYVIDTQPADMSVGGVSADIDRDGDPDVVMGGGSDTNEVMWWENPYPDYDPDTPWQRYTIKKSGETKHHDQIFGDFDGNGEPELVYWNQRDHALLLAPIPADPRNLDEWPAEKIWTWEGNIRVEGLAAADVDLDGRLDLLGGGRWFRNEGNRRFSALVIDNAYRYGRVVAGQLIPGGRPEVVMSIGDEEGELAWYTWDGENWVGTKMGMLDHGHTLQLGDVNADGHLDIFAAEMRLDGSNGNAGMWIFYGNGMGSFSRTSVARGLDNHESMLADLDGDGDLDILGKPFNHQTPALDIWLNTLNEDARFTLGLWQRHVIDAERPGRALFVEGADLDGDGLEDVVTGGWWYRSPGQIGQAWQRSSLGEGLNNMAAVADFDGDGDLDVLGTRGTGSEENPNFVWSENDGEGGLTSHDNIQPGAGTFLQGVALGEFRSDQTGAALSWHTAEGGIQLLTVPDDPAAETWPVEPLTELSLREGLAAGDIDGDGQTDLLLGGTWMRNEGQAWTEQAIPAARGEPDRVRLADMNGDGRLDVVLGYEGDSKAAPLVWYEQQDDLRWKEHRIADPQIVAPMSVAVADMDGDDDLDVVAGEHNLEEPDKAALYVFENADGAGTEWNRYVVHVGDEHHSGAQVADFDGDGDLDIVSIGWNHSKVIVYENLAWKR